MGFNDKFNEMLRELREEKKDELNSLADGFLTKIFIEGDYRNIGKNIIIQKQINGKRVFGYADVNASKMTIYDESKVGGWNWKDIDNILSDISTLSRRKIKKDKIKVASLLETEMKYMIGTVFTEDTIYIILRGEMDAVVSYSDIKDVDYDEAGVTLKLVDDKEAYIYCQDADNYTKYRELAKNMYNFVMDILDMVENQN